MRKIPLIFDISVITFTAFLFFNATLKFFMPKNVALSLAVMLSIILAIFTLKVLINKGKRLSANNNEKKELKEISFQLDFMSSPDVKNLFALAYKDKGYTVIKQRTHLIIREENTAVFIKFGFEKVKKADVVKAYNVSGYDKVVIISSEYDIELLNFADRFNGKVILKDVSYAYKLLKETNNLPEITFPYHERKTRLKQTISFFANKKHAKRFFLFGVGFLFFSSIATIKAYYITLAGVCLLYAFYLKLFGKTEKKSAV
jgi:hypothetical protein